MDAFRRFAREVHRRSIWQVLALYLVGAWVAYEVILALTEGVGLPEWVPPFAIVLFLIGLPIVVATAFVQEGLPAASEPTAGDGAGGRDGSGDRDGAAHRAPPEAGRADAAPDSPPHDAGSTQPAGAARPAARPDRPAQLLTWPRAITAGLLAFALLGLAATGFLGMRALGVGPMGTLVAKGELDATEPLVVADFTPLTGDTSLAAVVTEGLRAGLAQSQFVTTADRNRVRTTLERMLRDPGGGLDPTTAREVALRMGLKATVEGEVGRAGAGYLFTARVVTADSARTLATIQETAADSTEILAAIEALSDGVRERVGESLRAVRASEPLAQVTTHSLPALRKAVEALRLERTTGGRPRAIELMNEAVALDPGFAWAWTGLAVMHYNNNDLALAVHASEQAVAHADRLSEGRRYDALAMHASITGDLAGSVRIHEAWAAYDTTAYDVLIGLSDATWNQGRWDDAARHAERAIERGGHDNWVAHWNAVVAYMDGGRLDRSRGAIARADSMLPPENDGTVWGLRVQQAGMEGRYDSVHALGMSAPDGRGLWTAAGADRLMGRWDEARRHLRADGPQGDVWADSFEEWDLTMVLGSNDAADRVIARFDSIAAAQTDTTSGSFDAQLAVGLAMHARTDAARRVLDYYRAGMPDVVRWRDRHLLLAADAFIALHEGRGDDALATLRRARRATAWTAPVDAFLGRAFDLLDRPDSAVAAYTRYVETPWSNRAWEALMGDVVLLVPAHYRLALLHDEAGRTDDAARHAEAVLRYWGDADPVLAEHAATARRILARASAER